MFNNTIYIILTTSRTININKKEVCIKLGYTKSL